MLLDHIPRRLGIQSHLGSGGLSSSFIYIAIVSISSASIHASRTFQAGRRLDQCQHHGILRAGDGQGPESGPMQRVIAIASEYCTHDTTALYADLKVLWKSQVMLQSIIDCEAYGCGRDHFDVIETQAGKERSRTLLLNDHAQALHCRSYLLPLLLL